MSQSWKVISSKLILFVSLHLQLPKSDISLHEYMYAHIVDIPSITNTNCKYCKRCRDVLSSGSICSEFIWSEQLFTTLNTVG